jgi:hypothetical protein
MCFMNKTLWQRVCKLEENWGLLCLLLAVSLLPAFSTRAAAQDQDDPPGRVARLGYIEGSVSFQPAGEDEWVEAVPNRPLTTGDKIWADRDSRAEVQLGSASINLAPNTGFSFLNLDDRTTQIQLNAGSLSVRVWNLDRDNVFEIDTPNQAFTVEQPGRYRLDASEDGSYTVVAIREGEGESTGNGQNYRIHAGQRFTFSGTQTLNAEVDQIGGPDEFDNWSNRRERRYEDSPSARYCSRRVVGYQDLDDYGDWHPSEYGQVWFPRVDPGWAPYHEGHWAWIDPWGWTWVDNEPWGYAPFHYGRWVSVYGRWGWVPGPREERPVYAPALVAFVGGGALMAGGAVAWFPLGPREVYVPSYRVSEAYVNRVNVTNTTVNTTVVHNVYNTTIVNNNTTINNVTYVNRNVQGAVTAVPQHAFVSSQPVAKSAVAVNARQFANGPVSARAAVAPGRESVMGVHSNTAGRVAAPPQAVAARPVIAKAAPPPPPPTFAARQQAMAQHPGQPLQRQELQKMRPANAPASPLVKQAPPAKAATPTPATNRPGNQPGAPAANPRPGATPPPAAQPAPANQPGANNRPGQPNQPAPNNRAEQPGPPPASNDRPGAARPNNRPEPNPPNNRAEQPAPPPGRNDRPPSAQPNNRPEPNLPNNRAEQPAPPPGRNDRPAAAQPNNRPEPNPPNNRAEQPAPPPGRNDRPAAAQPNNRPEPNPPSDQPARTGHPPTEPPNNHYSEQPNNRPTEPPRNEPTPRTQAPPPSQRPDNRPPAEARPAPQPQRPQPNPAPQDNKKRQDQKDQKDQKDNKKPQ